MQNELESGLNVVTVRITGVATFIQSEQDSYAIGYYMSKKYGIFKLLLAPAENPPLYHDCCRPSIKYSEQFHSSSTDHSHSHHHLENDMLLGAGEADHLKTDFKGAEKPLVEEATTFFDLSLKQGNQTISVKNVQVAQPGSDALNFSSTWSDDVIGRHENDTGALFQSQAVKISDDAKKIAAKHFPILAQKDTVVNSGVLDLFYSTTTLSS